MHIYDQRSMRSMNIQYAENVEERENYCWWQNHILNILGDVQLSIYIFVHLQVCVKN